MKTVDPTKDAVKVANLSKNKQKEVRTTEKTPTTPFLVEMDSQAIQHLAEQVESSRGEMAEMLTKNAAIRTMMEEITASSMTSRLNHPHRSNNITPNNLFKPNPIIAE